MDTNCKESTKPLVMLGIPKFTATGSTGVSAPDFTVPKERGIVRGLDIFFDNNTITVLDDLKLTISSNGVPVLENVNALAFSSVYNTNRKPIPVEIPEAAVISVTATNGNATAVEVAVNLYFKRF